MSSSFNQLIGDLNELREKDYGDEARGAQRYVIIYALTIDLLHLAEVAVPL